MYTLNPTEFFLFFFSTRNHEERNAAVFAIKYKQKYLYFIIL